MPTFGSLFAGIGGIDLGLERAGWEARWQVEIDDFAASVLARHWPDVPRYRDVREVGAHNLEPVDLIAGGFPCQDISVAGKGAGLDGERSGLWFEHLRIVQELRPTWVLAENVPALRTRGADLVLDGLAAAGYAAWPLVVGARHVGAPHRRDRVWIVAHREGERRQDEGDGRVGGSRLGCDGEGGDAFSQLGHAAGVADTGFAGLAGRRGLPVGAGEEEPVLAGGGDHRWPSRPGEQQHGWEEPRVVHAASREVGATRLAREEASRIEGSPEPSLGSAVDGLSERLAGRHRRASLKALGNSVVPQVVEAIGRAIGGVM